MACKSGSGAELEILLAAIVLRRIRETIALWSFCGRRWRYLKHGCARPALRRRPPLQRTCTEPNCAWKPQLSVRLTERSQSGPCLQALAPDALAALRPNCYRS